MELKVVNCDITQLFPDAVVLPANPYLKEGSGVSTQLFEKAGREKLEKACEKIGKIEVGFSTYTPAFDFGSEYIIHSVVPKWIDGEHNEYELLGSAYYTALYTADTLGCKSISFPLLASGHNGFNKELSYLIAKKVISNYKPLKKLETVIIAVKDQDAIDMVSKLGDTVYINEPTVNIAVAPKLLEPIAQAVLDAILKSAEKIISAAIVFTRKMIEDEAFREKMLKDVRTAIALAKEALEIINQLKG